MFSGPPRLLIVDDESLIRMWLRPCLSDRGYQVGEAEDSQAALAALADAQAPPDVVLLDHPLPDSNGFTLLSRILKRAPKARVILTSADHAPDTATRAVQAGACAVLNKPFEIHELLAVLDREVPARSAD